MNKISVAELLKQRGMTWYGLHRQTGISKSMCHDWFRGRHLPCNRSAARIARVLGISSNSLLTRDQWDNLPRTPWATSTRKALQDASTRANLEDRIVAVGLVCPTCNQIQAKAA